MDTDQRDPAGRTFEAGSESEMLRAFLRERDARCPRCGYNLRMLEADTCPECGVRIVLGVHAAEPILRAWVCATVSASLAAGIGLLFLVLIMGRPGMPPAQYWPIVFGSIAAIPVVLLLILKRRSFTKRAMRMQWWIAGLLVTGVVVLLVGLSSMR